MSIEWFQVMSDQSQIIARLTYDIDGNSGVMPSRN